MLRAVTGAIVVVALAGCGSAPTAAPKDAPPDVRIAQIGGTTVPATIETTGTVGMQRETSLGFTSAGRIAAIPVTDGDTVRPGQLLAALDTTTVVADLSSARAERERAAAEYSRSDQLFRQGWITRPRLDSAKATLAAADARVRATGFQSTNAIIHAPGAGRILSRLTEPGQVVAAGTPVVVLGEEASGYVLRVPMTDRNVAGIRVGAPLRVQIDSLGDAPLAGQVSEVAGRSDRTTGTFTVEISLPADPRLRAGQIGSASIVANGVTAMLAVPSAAVFAPRAGEGFVYVVDPANRRVKLRKVAIAEATDADIRVTGGLRGGEWVAVSRLDRLTDGAAINPVRADNRAKQ